MFDILPLMLYIPAQGAFDMTSKTQAPEQPDLREWHHAIIVGFLERRGMTKNKTAQLGGRVNPELLALARKSAGVETDSQLIELALGNLVLEDGFQAAFRASRGTVSREIDLEA